MLPFLKKYLSPVFFPLDQIKLEKPLFDFGDSGKGMLNLFNENFLSTELKNQKSFNPHNRHLFSQFYLYTKTKPGKIKLSGINGIGASKLHHGKDLKDFESFDALGEFFHTDWYVNDNYAGYKEGHLQKYHSKDKESYENEIDWEMDKITQHHFSECSGSYYYKAYSNELFYANSGTSHRFTMLCYLDKKYGLGRYIDGDIAIERINREWCYKMLEHYQGYIFAIPGPESQIQILQQLFLGKPEYNFVYLRNPRKYFEQFLIMVSSGAKFDHRAKAWLDKKIEEGMILSFESLIKQQIDFEDSQDGILKNEKFYFL